MEAAEAGIHPQGQMPFSHPWTEARPEDLPANTARRIWRARAESTPEKWSLHFGVWRGSDFVGCQDLSAEGFGTLKTVSTGSWLRQDVHGNGLGKEMRTAVIIYAFDWLKADTAVSEAAVWNASSLGVSKSLGYEPNGIFRESWKPGEVTEVQYLRLRSDRFIRPTWNLDVRGHIRSAEYLGIPLNDG
ncbi:GNAT family N-acetyltransferase [Arthrobacter sp. FW306-07-I]|uniref:GNAT family N-acetyltransferase n=1 Tax=Arthrobacter sp. FW306-07-I TaxID=2879622 RepID=UPI00301B28FA